MEVIGTLTYRPTRFSEFGYTHQAAGMWRFMDSETKDIIGEIYPTKAELLADIERFYQARFV